jgi:gamma-glutamylcyclotransferase (GGCT)/AIG2-like uncharacterized protein YtfP
MVAQKANETAIDESEGEAKDTQGIRIFVYGTLKLKGPNWMHYLADNKGVEFLGRHIARGRYAMVNLHYYPGVCLDPSNSRPIVGVSGEVYRIDEETLAALDILEGNGRYFTRYQIDTPWKKAWMYRLPNEYLIRATSFVTPTSYAIDGLGTVLSWMPSAIERSWMLDENSRLIRKASDEAKAKADKSEQGKGVQTAQS